MKNNLIAISIFCFSLCFLIGSWKIGESMSNINSTQPKIVTAETKELLSEEDAARYLGLTAEEIQKLTKIKDGQNSYIHEIPFVEIANRVYYPKKGLDEWLKSIDILIVP